MTERVDFRASSFPLQSETLPSPPKSRPLGEGGCEHSEQTEGVSPTGCIQTDILICCVSRLLIYQLGEIRTFFALLIYQFGLGNYSTEGEGVGKEESSGGRQSIKNYRQNGKCNRNY